MENLTVETFKTKIFDFEKNETWNYAGERPVIIDFYADWCAPCRALAPVLEQVAKEYEGRVDVYKVNTETDPMLAALFSVRGIPAILFVPKQGDPAMSSGYMPVESFRNAIKDLFGIS